MAQELHAFRDILAQQMSGFADTIMLEVQRMEGGAEPLSEACRQSHERTDKARRKLGQRKLLTNLTTHIMGLDMSLTKRTYVKNWDWMKPEDTHLVTVLKGGKPTGIKPERVGEIIEDVAYWRKANAIHLGGSSTKYNTAMTILRGIPRERGGSP